VSWHLGVIAMCVVWWLGLDVTFVSHNGNFPFLLSSHRTATFAKLSRKFLAKRGGDKEPVSTPKRGKRAKAE
jgi:hypothetical protein